MVIGSLNQLWAVGAFISLIVVFYLGLMILKEKDDKKSKNSLSASSMDAGSAEKNASRNGVSTDFPLSPPGREVVPPSPPGKEVNSSDLSGGSNG